MHKTKSGRWQPDRPPKPEVHQAHDRSYDSYLVHTYTHMLCDRHPDCFWCAGCGICAGLAQGRPFAILENVQLGKVDKTWQ